MGKYHKSKPTSNPMSSRNGKIARLPHEIRERTHMEIDDLVDVLNGLMDAGFVETIPPSERVNVLAFDATVFEVNPAYAQELRVATRR